MRILKTILIIIFGLALFIAVCRLFNYDPFGMINWMMNFFTYTITKLADMIYNFPFFRKLFGK